MRPTGWMHDRFLAVMVLGNVLSLGSRLSAQPFVSPIGGVPYQDWTIVNYVDLDPTSNIRDFRNGDYTYNSHNAIDFTLPNFAAMDRGIPVLAAGFARTVGEPIASRRKSRPAGRHSRL